MQEALPYRNWRPVHQENTQNDQKNSPKDLGLINFFIDEKCDLKNFVKEKAVIVFATRGCCMSHVVKRLLQGQGINPAVYEVDEHDENDVIDELQEISAGDRKEGNVQFPVVFIGGRLFGGLDRIIAAHITGELTPVLKQAGALWL